MAGGIPDGWSLTARPNHTPPEVDRHWSTPTPPDPYPLRTVLFCRFCEQVFFGTTLSDGTRAYRSRCGCRLHPFDAAQVERRVYAEAQRLAYHTVVTSITCDCLAALALRMFARISLGTTTDDIAFTKRI